MSGNPDSTLLGDPSYWEWWPMFSGENDSFNMARCPHCGSAVINVYQHKAWHLQNDAKESA